MKRDFPPAEIVAVCQCSGNRRGLFQPHVAGVNGATARWATRAGRAPGSRTFSTAAGLAKETIEIAFEGADGPPVDKTPDFVKSIPIWKALDPDTLVAYEMNGQPLPHFNGAPARIVVPGWTATYWMKHVTRIEARSKPEENFWMKSAYRIPVGKFPLVQRFLSQETAVNTPITEMVVNSVVTAPAAGDTFAMGQPLTVRGVAWDGGYGIARVEVSTDDGRTWSSAGARPRRRPLLIPPMVVSSADRPPRRVGRHGPCYQHDRADPNRWPDPESGRVSPQPDAPRQRRHHVRHAMRRVFCTAFALGACTLAFADETAITLKDAAGKEAVLNNCAACHSLDYVQMNSPFPDPKLWDAEVTKMIKAFGAPIGDANAKAITEYLARVRVPEHRRNGPAPKGIAQTAVNNATASYELPRQEAPKPFGTVIMSFDIQGLQDHIQWAVAGRSAMAFAAHKPQFRVAHGAAETTRAHRHDVSEILTLSPEPIRS